MPSGAGSCHPAARDDGAFRALVRAEGARLYRDLPWRDTRDPYVVWLSEVMLQQTQVTRVEKRMPAWLDRFPTVEVLADASTAEVLSAWQGMGYNRRALALKAAAEKVVRDYDGVFPSERDDLLGLPGVGPATAQGIRAFAFDLPGVYLETNVRSVFLYHFFPDAVGVPDKELVPLVERTCPAASLGAGAAGDGIGADPGACAPYAVPVDVDDTPRAWYYALLDYGAHLKRLIPNPSRRSGSYARQSSFEGSYRQKRAVVVRELLAAHDAALLSEGGPGLAAGDLLDAVNRMERSAGRSEVDEAFIEELLGRLASEGFCCERDGCWEIAG